MNILKRHIQLKLCVMVINITDFIYFAHNQTTKLYYHRYNYSSIVQPISKLINELYSKSYMMLKSKFIPGIIIDYTISSLKMNADNMWP